MKQFRIIAANGHDYGVFSGKNELAAWRAMGTDAGYGPDCDPEVFSWQEIPEHVSVEEIKVPEKFQ